MKKKIRIGFGLIGMQAWWGGDFRPVLDVVRMAEQLGMDQVSITDHVVMGENLDAYPFGKFPVPLDYPWYEPLVVLGAIAAVTQRIKLSTGILIAPLRPAVLLAKQLATLDVMSRGRVEIGLGVGWQKEEYEASGIPFEGRFGRLEEQIRVCQLLWRQSPADFSGKTVSFDKIHAWPRPVQPDGIPVWMGLQATERNCERIAELGHGWVPIHKDVAPIADGVRALRAAFSARGRDPSTLEVCVGPRMKFDATRKPDLEAALADAHEYVAAGATVLQFFPSAYCSEPQQLEAFFTRLVRLGEEINRDAY